MPRFHQRWNLGGLIPPRSHLRLKLFRKSHARKFSRDGVGRGSYRVFVVITGDIRDCYGMHIATFQCAVEVRRHTPWSRVRCHGCWLTHSQLHSQFHSRWHSLRITLKYTTLVRMRSNTLLKPKRHSLRCHGFMVHALLLRMHTNVVYFRVMRRLCRLEWNWLWNWLCVNLHPWQRTRDHVVWRLTLIAYNAP